MIDKRTIQIYDKREKQGKYYYQLNGKSIQENYIDIMKQKQQERKQQIDIENEIEKIIDKVIAEALKIK